MKHFERLSNGSSNRDLPPFVQLIYEMVFCHSCLICLIYQFKPVIEAQHEPEPLKTRICDNFNQIYCNLFKIASHKEETSIDLLYNDN